MSKLILSAIFMPKIFYSWWKFDKVLTKIILHSFFETQCRSNLESLLTTRENILFTIHNIHTGNSVKDIMEIEQNVSCHMLFASKKLKASSLNSLVGIKWHKHHYRRRSKQLISDDQNNHNWVSRWWHAEKNNPTTVQREHNTKFLLLSSLISCTIIAVI